MVVPVYPISRNNSLTNIRNLPLTLRARKPRGTAHRRPTVVSPTPFLMLSLQPGSDLRLFRLVSRMV